MGLKTKLTKDIMQSRVERKDTFSILLGCIMRDKTQGLTEADV